MLPCCYLAAALMLPVLLLPLLLLHCSNPPQARYPVNGRPCPRSFTWAWTRTPTSRAASQPPLPATKAPTTAYTTRASAAACPAVCWACLQLGSSYQIRRSQRKPCPHVSSNVAHCLVAIQQCVRTLVRGARVHDIRLVELPRHTVTRSACISSCLAINHWHR